MLRSSNFQKEMTQHFLIKHLSPIDIFLLSLAFSSLLSCYPLPCSTSLHLTLTVSPSQYFFLPFLSLFSLLPLSRDLVPRSTRQCIVHTHFYPDMPSASCSIPRVRASQETTSKRNGQKNHIQIGQNRLDYMRIMFNFNIVSKHIKSFQITIKETHTKINVT